MLAWLLILYSMKPMDFNCFSGGRCVVVPPAQMWKENLNLLTRSLCFLINPLSKSFGSDQQWDTLPCESVILVLQLVDKTDQGVLQVSHLTDERLQGQLQLLLLSLKKGKTDMGGGQRHPITHAFIIQSVLQTASSSEEEEILEIKILLFPTDPFPLGQTT